MRQKLLHAVALTILGSLLLILSGATGGEPPRLADAGTLSAPVEWSR